MMDVFLIPIADARYELYCEAADRQPAAPASPPRGVKQRVAAVFWRLLAEGEEAEREGTGAPRPAGGRIRRAISRRLAAAVAEQRLLWGLRGRLSARLYHPDDVPAPVALDAMRGRLFAERGKHARWCAIDGLLALLSAPLALVPGPNVLGYYFLFRAVGHYLSFRGARDGLSRVVWTGAASPELTAIRAALALVPEARAPRVHDLGSALGLARLAPFLEATLARSS